MSADAAQLVIAAFLAFCRVGACFMVIPGLSSARVPMQVRLFVAVAASTAMFANVYDQIAPVAGSLPGVLAFTTVSELLTGGLIGLMARLYVMALLFIASATANMIGFAGALGGAIEENEPQATLATIISFAALLLLFVMDFHHDIIRALVGSYRVLPPGAAFSPQAAMVDITDTLSESFLAALRLGSPFLAYALLVNLAIGFINKLTPQIPVYFISLPFVLAGGLLLIYLGIGPLLRIFADGFVPLTIGR